MNANASYRTFQIHSPATMIGIQTKKAISFTNLATDAIFLASESESYESDAVEVSELTTEWIKAIVVNE